MASSRRSRPADAGAAAVEAAVDAALAGLAGGRVAVALSGGRDSSALLAAGAACAPRHRVALCAVHVHHGLSRFADDWAATCERLCAAVGVPLAVERVTVTDAAALGTEAAARRARYAALRRAAVQRGAGAIALAHHRDDQVETLLLQALRGAGPHGLASMPAQVVDDAALTWLRPLLGVPRSAIEAFVAARRLAFVDDDSNASARHRRNALRNDVMPALVRAFPEAARTLARVAAHQAEAAALLDALAALDAQGHVRDGTLACAALAALPPPRARNLLRWFLRTRALPAPSAARLDAMLAQLASPRADAQVRIDHAGVVLGVHRARIHVHAPPPPAYEVRWRGERELRLPHGALHVVAARGAGLDGRRLEGRVITAGSRRDGERIALDALRPRRALAAWLYDLGLPPWQRDALPRIRCDGVLAAVPTLGTDVAWQGEGGDSALAFDWRPDPVQPAISG